MMNNIITLNGCIEKEEHVWTRKIETKFLILDPRLLQLNELDAKYQLFYLIYDPKDDKPWKTDAPYLGKRCIDDKEVFIERISVIGEPTFNTLLEWNNIYGNESAFKKNMTDKRKSFLMRKCKNSIEEKYYEIAFIWNDQK